MAGQKNLIPQSERTKEEQREIARKGGKASGKARREKKLMKEQISLLLSLPLKDKRAKDKLKALGINADNIDNQMAMLISLWNTAIKGGKGSVEAAKFLRDTVGEKPIEEVKVNNQLDATISEIEKYVENK